MATTTTTRSHALTYPNSLGPNWYNSFSSYAQQITAHLDNIDTTALTEIQHNATSAKILTFSHVAAGTYPTCVNNTVGSGALLTVISSNSNENLRLVPKGSGQVLLDYNSLPNSDGSANQVLKTNGAGALSWSDLLVNLATSPVIGGNLDVSTFSLISSGANHVPVTSANDIVLKLGDAAGAKKVRIKDSANAEVFSIDSDGATVSANLTVTATATVNTLNIDNESLDLIDLGISSLSEITFDGSDKLVVYDTSAGTNKITPLSTIRHTPKAFAKARYTGSAFELAGVGISSATRTASGLVTITMSPAMSTSTYTVLVTGGQDGSVSLRAQLDTTTQTTTQFKVVTTDETWSLNTGDFYIWVMEA